MNRTAPLALAFIALSGLAGCALHDVDYDPAAPVALPDRFGGQGGTVEASERWWTEFGDAGLDDAVARTLAGNLDLRAAWARVDQLGAVIDQIRAGGLPQLEAKVGAGYGRTVMNLSQPIGRIENDQANYSISVGAGFELDLWGRVASLDSAAALDRLATRQNLEAIAVTLTATVSEVWFMLAEQQALRSLLEEQLTTSETQLDLIGARFGVGMASTLDVRQQRQQIAALRARLPLIDGRIASFRTQLAVLMGAIPGGDLPLPGASIPSPPPLPVVGLPSEVLLARPDVKAARTAVIAADHRVAAAIADQLPAFRLGASTGFQDSDLATLFTSWVFNLAANLVAPLFDGGRRAAEVDRTRAAVEERVWTFGSTLLAAFKEVEDALELERRQHEHIVRLDSQLTEARSTLDEAQRRYSQGLIDYLPVLTALSGVQQSEQALLSARRQLLSYRIQLHRALGGAWTRTLTRPRAPESGDAEVAARGTR